MSGTFKLCLGSREYRFYRTILRDNITYIILFDRQGDLPVGERRDSVFVIKDRKGCWEIDNFKAAPDHISENSKAIIGAILKNEDTK